MSVEDLLTMQGVLERPTKDKDAGGRIKNTYAVVDAEVPCMVQELYLRSGQANMEESSQRLLNNLQVFFAAEQDVQAKDRLTVDGQAYVIRMITPAKNALTGETSHLEGILDLDDQLAAA